MEEDHGCKRGPLQARELLFKQAMDLFECTQCGTCCQGEGGIHLTPEEIDRISDFLNFSPRDFLKKFCLEKNGRIYIHIREDGYCHFSREGKCSIHAVKPSPCRKWPFFETHADRPAQLGNGPPFLPGPGPLQDLKRLPEKNKVSLGHPGERIAFPVKNDQVSFPFVFSRFKRFDFLFNQLFLQRIVIQHILRRFGNETRPSPYPPSG